MFVMQTGLFAEQRSPAFERFVVVSFPVRVIGLNANERINVKAQIRPVRKQDADSIAVFHWPDFHCFHDLASDFRKVRLCTSLAGTCTLLCSHVASHTGDLVRGASVTQSRHVPIPVLAQRRIEHKKNEANAGRKSRMCVIYITPVDGEGGRVHGDVYWNINRALNCYGREWRK